MHILFISTIAANVLFSYIGVTLDDLCSPKLSGIPLPQAALAISRTKAGNTVYKMQVHVCFHQKALNFFCRHWMTIMNVVPIF